MALSASDSSLTVRRFSINGIRIGWAAVSSLLIQPLLHLTSHTRPTWKECVPWTRVSVSSPVAEVATPWNIWSSGGSEDIRATRQERHAPSTKCPVRGAAKQAGWAHRFVSSNAASPHHGRKVVERDHVHG